MVSVYKYMVSFTGIAFCSFCLEQIRQTRFYLFLCWMGTLTLDIYVCHGYFRIDLGNGVWQYFVSMIVTLLCALALTFLVLKRFRITRLLFLGQRY